MQELGPKARRLPAALRVVLSACRVSVEELPGVTSWVALLFLLPPGQRTDLPFFFLRLRGTLSGTNWAGWKIQPATRRFSKRQSYSEIDSWDIRRFQSVTQSRTTLFSLSRSSLAVKMTRISKYLVRVRESNLRLRRSLYLTGTSSYLLISLMRCTKVER